MEHWITQLRRKNSLTQAQLADRLKIHVNAVSRIERGISSPSYETLTKLCEIFGTEEVTKFLPNYPGAKSLKKAYASKQK